MTHSELFQKIEQLVPTLPGWCLPDKACQLATAVLALRPKTTVEIGVFGGRSCLPFALACQMLDHGTVIAIDPWSAVASAEGYEGENLQWWSNLDHNAIHDGFVACLKDMRLEDTVKILRAKSDDVTPPTAIDILHIDGQHTDQAVRDVERFSVNVNKGGFCFTDDDDWSGGGPAQACKRLMEIGFVPLYKCGTGTAFQRVR